MVCRQRVSLLKGSSSVAASFSRAGRRRRERQPCRSPTRRAVAALGREGRRDHGRSVSAHTAVAAVQREAAPRQGGAAGGAAARQPQPESSAAGSAAGRGGRGRDCDRRLSTESRQAAAGRSPLLLPRGRTPTSPPAAAFASPLLWEALALEKAGRFFSLTAVGCGKRPRSPPACQRRT